MEKQIEREGMASGFSSWPPSSLSLLHNNDRQKAFIPRQADLAITPMGVVKNIRFAAGGGGR